MNCSSQGSSVHRIFQARVLEWVGDLPDLGIEPATLVSPGLAGKFFTTSTTWEVVNVGNIKDSLLNMTSKAENRKKNNDTLDGSKI